MRGESEECEKKEVLASPEQCLRLKAPNLPITVLVSSVTTSWAVFAVGGSEGVSKLLFIFQDYFYECKL